MMKARLSPVCGHLPALLGAFALALAFAVPLPVTAADGPARENARIHYREGLKHFNLGEYDDALREFKASYRLFDDSALLFNIGLCEAKLGQRDAALRSYRSFLRMQPHTANRADVERRIRELDAGPAATDGAGTPLTPNPTAPPPNVLVPAPSTAVASPPPRPPSQVGSLETRTEQSSSPFRSWKVWAIVSGVVIAGVAIAVGTTNRETSPPVTDLGTHRVFR